MEYEYTGKRQKRKLRGKKRLKWRKDKKKMRQRISAKPRRNKERKGMRKKAEVGIEIGIADQYLGMWRI